MRNHLDKEITSAKREIIKLEKRVVKCNRDIRELLREIDIETSGLWSMQMERDRMRG